MTKDLYDPHQETEQPKKDLYSVFLEITEEKKAALKSAIYASTPIPPEAATKQYQLSRQTSLPVNVVRAKENEIKKMTEIQSFDYEDLVNNFPQTALQLSDPNKTAAIKDDVDSLTYFEKIVANTKQEFKANLAGGMTTNLRLKKMIADIKGESLSNKEENELALYYQGQGDQVDYELGLFKNEAQELLAKAPALTIGQLPSIAQTLGYAAPAAIGGFAIAGPAGATVAGTGAAFLGSSKRMTADAYDEFKNFTDENGERIEPKVAAGAALLTGGVGGFLEFLSIGKAVRPFKGLFTKKSAEQLLKTSAGREALKNIAGMALVEGGTEASQELSNIIFGEAAKLTSEKEFKPFGVKKDKVTPEAVAKYLTSKPVTERVGEAGVAGFIGGTGFGVFSSGVNYANQRYQARKKQEEEKKIIDDVVKRTSESKVYQRDPELFKEVTKDTLGSQNVYFPAEEVATYFQDKPDQLNQFFNASPSAREQLDEARQIGGNIIIPGNEAADILNREPELRKYASLSPEGYVESLLQDSAIDDSIRIQDLADEQVKTKKELNQVQKNIESRILNLGMPYRDARDIIALTNAFYETQSQRVGSKEAQKILDTYLGQLETQRQVAPKAPAMPRIEDLDLLLDKARKETKIKNKKPVLKFLREKGVKPDSNLAGELKAIGINPKTAPGLFKKSGIGDVDNFPLSEVQTRFPNVQIPADETGNYADRQAILDLIAQEQSGVDISKIETETSQFVKQLDELGIDLNTSNEEIKKAIKEYQGRTFNQGLINPLLKPYQGMTKKEFLGEARRVGAEDSKFLTPKEHESNKDVKKEPFLDGKFQVKYGEDNFEVFDGDKVIANYNFGDTLIVDKKYRRQGIAEELVYQWRLRNPNKPLAKTRNAKSEKLQEKVFNRIQNEINNTYFQTQDQTKTPAFKKWFGNSKVVDEKGEPLVVYHGSNAKFDTFDIARSGSNWSAAQGAFFFSSSLNTASNYAIRGGDGANVMPVYLKIKNPYTTAALDPIDYYDLTIRPERYSLEAQGHDGVIIKSAEGHGDLYVVFNASQIKSVENKGTFDPENANIYYQSAPTFYSALEKQITDLPQGKGSPEQWAGIIKNLTQKGVKQEELDWTGIEEWIKEQKGSVTKEQILDYLKANKIEVEEVVKGDISGKVDLVINKTEDGYFKVIHPEKGVIYTASFEDQAQRYIDEYAPDSLTGIKSTKFSKYTLAGGENYRELLLTLPIQKRLDDVARLRYLRDQGKERAYTPNERIEVMDLQERLDEAPELYKSSHYDESNILAHIRFNERTDKDGNKVMFIEEIQSDWHQEGRKKGYKKDAAKLTQSEQREYEELIEYGRRNLQGDRLARFEELIIKKEASEQPGVPDAPFKTTWNELAFKRALLWAVENGFDKVAWTTGEMQAERYDLSKQVDRVIYTSDGRLIAIKPDGDEVIDKEIAEKDIEDYVGKEVARKLLESKADKQGARELNGENLKVGGEGMKGFYDKILPTAVNKLIKKFGGKVEQIEIDAGKVWSLDITPAMQETISKQGLPLFQNASSPKGQTQFIGQKPVITLFEKADRSTLLHELGHVFLQTQADIAKLENVAPEFKKDWNTLEDWLGVKDGVITREAHEKFARGFEAYLREGKAPSIGLRDAFRRFKNWLLRIYQDVMQLNVKLNDDVRDVFDRMLATKEAIDAQKNNPLYRADDDVMELLTKKEKEDYLKITQNAGAKAEEKLLVKALKQKTIENKEFYKNELKQVKKEIQEELNQDKTYRVLTFLKTGKIPGTEGEATPLKLSRQDIKDNYDGELLKYLPNEIFGKDGVEVSLIADEFGFKSGSEMLYAIANAPDYKKEVSRLAKEEMIRRYGDMLYDGTIEQEALEASQNEARANKILYELNAAGRKINSLKESKDAYKQKASEILSKKALRDVDVNSFYLAEIKAAKEAGKYLAKKDYKKAVEAKKKQLLNHYLFRESKLLKDEIQKSLKRYAKYKKKPVKGKVKLEEDYREKIVGLLQDFELAKKSEEYQQTNIQELESWKKEKQNEGVLGLVEFPEIADFQGKSFNQLTVNEYRTLDDAIENLAHVGESLRFIEINGKKVELDSIASKIDESIRSHLEPKKVIRGTLTPKEKLIDAFDQFVMPLIKAKALVKELDGKDRGTLYKSFIDPVADAELVRNDMTKEAVDKFNSIVQKYFPKGFPKKRQYFASVNAEYNKESILAFALNWGTETNRKRIRDGFNYSDAQVLDMLSTLTKDELQFVQEMWDFIGSYWERISSLQKKLIGFAPRKEKASPVTIKSADGQDVSLKGGYYPLSYTEESNLKSDSAAQFGTINPRMEFEKSFTKERTEKRVNKEVTLTLIPAINHLADVVNDLAMKEQAWNSDKILNHPKVKKAIIDTKGSQTFKQLKFWLEDLFGTATNSAGVFGKAINYLRAGTTISQMGLKIATTVMQISGYPQSIVKIGVKPMAKGFLKFIGNGNPLGINKNYQMALEKSKILKSRATSFHQDIYDTLRIMEGKGKIARNSTSIYFYPMAKMQMMVDVPTWWGAYYKGLDKFKEESEAVKYADQMVVQSQGSGLSQDLSAFERGSVGGLRKSNLIKIFTAFYTYMNAKLNLAYESYQGTDFKKPRDVAKFASDMVLLYFVEAFLGQLLVRKVPDFEDDEESATLYAASLMAQNFFGQFPIGREAVSAAQGFDATPAGLTGIENIVKGISYAGKELTEEEPDMTKIIEGINQSGGILFHYPSGQVDVFIDALQKAQEGEDVAPIDYLLKPKK